MFPVASGVALRYPPIATWALIATNVVVFLFEVDMVRDLEGQTEPASPETSEFSEADEKVIEQLRARFSNGKP